MPEEKPQKSFKKKILEKDVEGPVRKAAIKNGWLVYKWCSVNNRSVPDRIFIKEGKCYFVEFKALNKQLTPAQADIAEDLKREGMAAIMIDCVADGTKYFT